jgi:anti-sigma factor RsiW
VTGPARTLEELADAYLDGDLPREEALAFERDLASRPASSVALAAALTLRELLATLPPLSPPAGLADRIADALPLSRSAPARRGEPTAVRAALAGFSWTFRGTATGALGALAPALSASAGLSQVRWALGPLGAPAEPVARTRRPLWRRVLFGRAKA